VALIDGRSPLDATGTRAINPGAQRVASHCTICGREPGGVERVVERIAWKSLGLRCSGSTSVWYRCR